MSDVEARLYATDSKNAPGVAVLCIWELEVGSRALEDLSRFPISEQAATLD
jgi:hypothetical protein